MTLEELEQRMNADDPDLSEDELLAVLNAELEASKKRVTIGLIIMAAMP